MIRRPLFSLTLSALSVAFVACGGGGQTAGTGGKSGSGGANTATGGSTSSGGSTGSGGSTNSGGRTGTGGTSAGTGGSSSGSGGTGSGGAVVSGWTCPAGPFTGITIPTGSTATRIAGAPPDDAFNNNGNNWMNIEGPVWAGDALYISEMAGSPNPPATRILKITEAGVVTIAAADSGTNGMAVDSEGNLVTANHGVGGIVRFALPAFSKTTLIAMFSPDTSAAKRFNSPNDLTIRSDGYIFFTDPSFQAPTPSPQNDVQRVYALAKGASTATVLVDNAQNPNGIALSLDEKFLFIGDGSGIMKYELKADGTIVKPGTVVDSADLEHHATDGMAIDCAGNVYVVRVNERDIVVVNPAGTKIGAIAIPASGNPTNVAFGGADHRTLFVTTQGTGTQRGVFKLAMPLPGLPY